jgi:hypothetical protein
MPASLKLAEALMLAGAVGLASSIFVFFVVQCFGFPGSHRF